MAGIITHLSLISESLVEQKKKFEHLDKAYLYSGAVFPDVNLFLCYHHTPDDNLSRFWHTGKNGFMFGKKMLEYSKNKKERSFAIGFMSHFILDNQIHGYLTKKKIKKSVYHTVCEFFLDAQFKNKNIPVPKYCKALINRVLKHEYPEISKNYFTSVLQRRYYFSIVNNIIQKHLVTKKYRNTDNSKRVYFLDVLMYHFGKKHAIKMKSDINEIIYPKAEIKKKYLYDLTNEYNLAKKKFYALDFDNVINIKKR